MNLHLSYAAPRPPNYIPSFWTLLAAHSRRFARWCRFSFSSGTADLVVALAVVALVVVLVLEEKVLVCAVPGKRNRGRAQARQRAAEAVEASKGALESPGVTVEQTR